MLASQGFQERETARMEAFSDGVFAFAITLLALDLRDPLTFSAASLADGLWNELPAFFALGTSFATVLIMWVNHHNMFNYIRRIDSRLMFINGLLLLFVIVTPFTTMLVADHIMLADARTAAAVYAGTFLLLSFVWNGLWRYAASGLRLMGKGVTEQQVHTVRRQYWVAPTFYGIALVVSLINGLASVVIILLVAGFFGVTASLAERREERRKAHPLNP